MSEISTSSAISNEDLYKTIEKSESYASKYEQALPLSTLLDKSSREIQNEFNGLHDAMDRNSELEWKIKQ